MWYDIWSFSYKQQILNFWSRSEMVRKLRFQTGLSENCVFGPPGEPVFSKILKNYFFMISFISFNDIITFLKHLGKMTFLRLYLPLIRLISKFEEVKKWSKSGTFSSFRLGVPIIYWHWDNYFWCKDLKKIITQKNQERITTSLPNQKNITVLSPIRDYE